MSSTKSMEVLPAEWLKINQFLLDLKKINSPCISVYYPYGKGHETISLLQKTKRDESLEKVETKIEEKIAELKKNPSSVGKFVKTLCIFGWVENGKIQIKEIGTSKKLPYIYMSNKRPYTKPFRDILKVNHDVLLVILDQKSARIQKFHGSQVIQEAKLRIDLQGRHRKGGQSQGRFLRARQTKIHVFFKKVADKVKSMNAKSDLILLGGNGNAKTEFSDYIDSKLAQKCKTIENLSFSSTPKDIHKMIIQQLYQYRRNQVAKIIAKYEKLVKEGLTAKKNSVISSALERGAVETLIVSADYHTDVQFRNIIRMLEIAKNTSARIEFVSSPNIINKLKIHDSVLAILRYKIK